MQNAKYVFFPVEFGGFWSINEGKSFDEMRTKIYQ